MPRDGGDGVRRSFNVAERTSPEQMNSSLSDHMTKSVIAPQPFVGSHQNQPFSTPWGTDECIKITEGLVEGGVMTMRE
jgi:hypothetical protein